MSVTQTKIVEHLATNGLIVRLEPAIRTAIVSNRRTFIRRLAGVLLVAPFAAHAESSGRMARIGVLLQGGVSTDQHDEMTLALKHFGYAEGRNAIIEWRWAEGRSERLIELARELVKLKVDVIIAFGSSAAQAAKGATSTIPIVFEAGDPVATDLIQSLPKPGGNLTGVSLQFSELAAKYLQLLRYLLPDAADVVVLWSPGNASQARFLREADSVAAQFRFKLQAVGAANAVEVNSALAAIERTSPHAMIFLGLPFPEGDLRIVDFAIRNHIATLSGRRDMTERGLLMYYGVNDTEISRQLADYVDKILKGTKPANLPVQQPTKFEFVINLKTAKALGLDIPQSLLQRADELIQ